MKLSVIIACYNAADTIGMQMAALAEQCWSGRWEVIVADNRCNDNSMRIVKSFKEKLPCLRVVDAFERQGQAYALNMGAKRATGDAIVFSDADDVVGAGWLNAMGKALEQHKFVACRMDVKRLNCNRRMDDGKGNPQEKGVQHIWYPPYLPHAGSGTLGVKASLHKTVGGFDETLRYLFDTDYCFKIQMLTKEKLYFVSEAVMHIRNRQTLLGNYRQSRNYAEYNVVLFKRYRSTASESPNLWKQHMKDWLKLARGAPRALFKRNRYRFMWDFGRQVGRLKASLQLRVPPV